jgi:hypothetical protein
MKAIVTKYVGPTEKRGARIKVSAEGLPSVFDPYDSDVDAHDVSAHAFANKLGWLENGKYRLVRGGLPDGSMCHVLALDIVATIRDLFEQRREAIDSDDAVTRDLDILDQIETIVR